MSTATRVVDAFRPRIADWEYTWYTPAITAVAAVTIVLAMWLHGHLAAPDFASGGGGATGPGGSTPTQWYYGGGLAGLFAAEVAVLAAAYYSLQYLPEWLRDAILSHLSRLVLVYIGALIGAVAMGIGSPGVVFVSLGVLFVLMLVWSVAHHYRVAWIGMSVATVGVCAAIGAVGAFLGLGPLLALTVVVAIIDPLAVFATGYMVAFGSWAVRRGLPITVIIPSGWRLDLDRAVDPDEVVEAAGIGNGDLIIPAAVATAANTAGAVPLAGGVTLFGTVVAVGCCAGVAFAIGRAVGDDEGVQPGMPPITYGIVAGVAVGWLLEQVVVTA